MVYIRVWSSLKIILIEDFDANLSSADIHNSLRNAHKKVSKSFLEYLCCLIEIRKHIRIDDESVIEYFVNGNIFQIAN